MSTIEVLRFWLRETDTTLPNLPVLNANGIIVDRTNASANWMTYPNRFGPWLFDIRSGLVWLEFSESTRPLTEIVHNDIHARILDDALKGLA